MADVVSAIQLTLNADLERLRTISQNLSNQGAPAYKRDQLIVDKFQTAFMNEAKLEPDLTLQKDFTQGAFKMTGNALDIALDGEGFLMASSGDKTLFTRKGQLRLNPDGYLGLVTGERVLGRSGPVALSDTDFEVQPDGSIVQDGVVLDKLAIAVFQNPEQLSYAGEGLFENPSMQASTEASDTQVMQSYLEMSNVNTMEEIVRLVELTRHYQLSHNVLKAYDGSIDSAISTLGKF
ncbi:flagellar hook basal-body protein [Hahella aquimaris]|uniref:flagellar hook basal-body protein n=1 Tax=Hahella sp. HNIBRBA332 TaxID=3015983 RepID=UPI00273C5EEF|nr:flagellar hook basal-body protein [Hahella sp. HNIBRBA332]WLQ15696.1 flagellar hook basal-body protein [Hahella sp. HNIBRBA332]